MNRYLSVSRLTEGAAQEARSEAGRAGYNTWPVFANENGGWQFYYEDAGWI